VLQHVDVAGVNDSTLFPVVLFVHADSYDVGTGNAYDGSVLAAFGHLVVVTFNFRLGALGTVSGVLEFLSTSLVTAIHCSCITVAATDAAVLTRLACCRVKAITTVL